MLAHVVVSALLFPLLTSSWVKVANFYQSPDYDPVLTPINKGYNDLVVIAKDTDLDEVRLPLKDAPYYELSPKWAKLNDSLYFGRLSVITKNYAHEDVEHNLLRFQGNMSVSGSDRAVMTVVRNDNEFSGSLCKLGSHQDNKKTFLNLCLHNLVEQGSISTEGIKIMVREASCSGCTRFRFRPRVIQSNSLQIGIPEERSTKAKKTWNVTVQYLQHTTLCHFIKELSRDDLNVIVMKQNLTVPTMFECVVFTEKISKDSMALWTPIVAGFLSVLILGAAATLFYKKCDRACIRQMMPTPDQDTDAAPYRSFNSSNTNHCDSPLPEVQDNRYIKMKSVTSDSKNGPAECETYAQDGHSIRSKPPRYESRYERI